MFSLWSDRRPWVGGIVHTSDGKVVLIKKTAELEQGNALYKLPGGKLEPNELALLKQETDPAKRDTLLRNVLKREIGEELSVELQNVEPIGTYRRLDNLHKLSPKRLIEADQHLTVYLAEIKPGSEPRPDGTEVGEIRLASIVELIQLEIDGKISPRFIPACREAGPLLERRLRERELGRPKLR